MVPGCGGTWRWTDGYSGSVRGTIGYTVGEQSVWLSYRADGQDAGQRISTERTRCTFGGSRPWFICPVRGERVAVLYYRARRFACRHCQRLAYASQSEDTCGRTWRRQAKLEARLGPNWSRPKGMYKTTHERLLATIRDCEERRDEVLAACIGFSSVTRRSVRIRCSPLECVYGQLG